MFFVKTGDRVAQSPKWHQVRVEEPKIATSDGRTMGRLWEVNRNSQSIPDEQGAFAKLRRTVVDSVDFETVDAIVASR
jgi:hypothetical protein